MKPAKQVLTKLEASLKPYTIIITVAIAIVPLIISRPNSTPSQTEYNNSPIIQINIR